MRANWLTRITWTFAVWYAFVAALGQGLHLLPGQGHDACCQHGETCCDDDCCSLCGNADDHCGDRDACDSQPVSVARANNAAIAASDNIGSHGEHHCAICDFLSHSMGVSQPVAIIPWQYRRTFQPAAKAISIVCRFEHRPFLSRAPPALAAC